MQYQAPDWIGSVRRTGCDPELAVITAAANPAARIARAAQHLAIHS
jgi:hypothetical protein